VKERVFTCAACHELIRDGEPDCWSSDLDNLVHVRCPLSPGAPEADASIIVGLGGTPAEKGWTRRPEPVDRGCAMCGEPMAGATESVSLVVDTETGGRRFTLCTECYDEPEPLAVF
jgi:hypothetical protein